MRATGTTCNVYLSELVAGMPWINGVAITGPNGRIRCSTRPNSTGIDVSDRDYYRAALATQDFVVSDYLIGRLRNTPTVIAVYPTQAIDADVEGAVIASLDLAWMSRLISSLDRRPGSNVLLIDSRGTVLAGDAGVADSIGKQVDDSDLYRAMGSREDGTLRAEGLDR